LWAQQTAATLKKRPQSTAMSDFAQDEPARKKLCEEGEGTLQGEPASKKRRTEEELVSAVKYVLSVFFGPCFFPFPFFFSVGVTLFSPLFLQTHGAAGVV
jgi:hypothetical protein